MDTRALWVIRQTENALQFMFANCLTFLQFHFFVPAVCCSRTFMFERQLVVCTWFFYLCVRGYSAGAKANNSNVQVGPGWSCRDAKRKRCYAHGTLIDICLADVRFRGVETQFCGNLHKL